MNANGARGRILRTQLCPTGVVWAKENGEGHPYLVCQAAAGSFVAGPAAVGTVVWPLSSNDLGAKVACGSRALVTADKGNGLLCVRSFAGVGAG